MGLLNDIGSTLEKGVSDFVKNAVDFGLEKQTSDYQHELPDYRPVNTTATTSTDYMKYIPVIVVGVIVILLLRK